MAEKTSMKPKKSLRDKVQDRRKKLKDRSSGSGMVYIKADTTIRVRILNTGDENEFIKEVVYFYLGSEIKGVISPATFGEPCAIMEKYQELKSSSDSDDKELAKKFSPKPKFLAGIGQYKDVKGKEVEGDSFGKLILLTSGLYEETTDLFLDEEEWGDMTDWDKGYDLKYSRKGSGKMDTEYSVTACQKTKCPKEFKKPFDLEAAVRKHVPSYEDTQEIIQKYLGEAEEPEEKPKKGLKKGFKRPFKKSKKDI